MDTKTAVNFILLVNLLIFEKLINPVASSVTSDSSMRLRNSRAFSLWRSLDLNIIDDPKFSIKSTRTVRATSDFAGSTLPFEKSSDFESAVIEDVSPKKAKPPQEDILKLPEQPETTTETGLRSTENNETVLITDINPVPQETNVSQSKNITASATTNAKDVREDKKDKIKRSHNCIFNDSPNIASNLESHSFINDCQNLDTVTVNASSFLSTQGFTKFTGNSSSPFLESIDDSSKISSITENELPLNVLNTKISVLSNKDASRKSIEMEANSNASIFSKSDKLIEGITSMTGKENLKSTDSSDENVHSKIQPVEIIINGEINVTSTMKLEVFETASENQLSFFPSKSAGQGAETVAATKNPEVSATTTKSTSGEVPSSTEQIMLTTGEVSSTTEQMISTTGEVSSTTEQMISTTGEVSSTTEQMISTTGEVSSTTEQMILTTEQITSTTEVSLPTEQSMSTTGEVSSTTEQSMSTTGEVSSTTEISFTAGEATSTTEQIMLTTAVFSSTTEEVPSTTEEMMSTTGEVSPTTEVPSTIEQITSTTEVSLTTEQTTSITEVSSTAGGVTSTTEQVVSTTEISSTTAEISSTAEVSSNTEQIMSTTEVSSTTEEVPSTTEQVTEVSSTTEEVPSTTEQVTEVSSTTGEISSSTEQIMSTTEQIISTTEQIISTTEQVSSTTEQISSTTEQVSSTTEQFSLDNDTMPLFEDSEPDNLIVPATTNSSKLSNIYNKSYGYEDSLLYEGTTEGCLYEDRERFRRNIQATAFAMLNEKPTMLFFSRNSSCVGTLSKTGERSVRSIQSMLPKFPKNMEVEAAGYIRGRIYLIDSSSDQNVWTFKYNSQSRNSKVLSHSKISKDAFLQLCDIFEYPKDVRIKAFGQVSMSDTTCIVFDNISHLFLSVNATSEAESLASAISYLVHQEFITYAESVFSWLDEPYITSVYIYGSNGELYRIFRSNSPNSRWEKGNYELLPYSRFPIPEDDVFGNL